MNRRERESRFTSLRRIGCIACLLDKSNLQCGPVEIHHLNAGGHAGQKRRGDEYTIPLGRFHHRGEPPEGMTKSEATFVYGPSLALDSKQFRFAYGDDDSLLAITQHKLARLEPEAA